MNDSICSPLPQQEAAGGGSLPLYYRENFFSSDTLFYTERGGHQTGIAGDPIPYTLRGDDLLSSLLLGSFIVLVLSIARSGHFIERQLKNFFFRPYHDSYIGETLTELRFQFFLTALLCLQLAIITYQYVEIYVTDVLTIDNELMLIGIFFSVYSAYLVCKGLLYLLVNNVFFGNQLSLLWMKTLLFINSALCILLFPIVLLTIFFDLSLQNVTYYFIFVLFAVKILTIYKGWTIFFSQNGGILQFFLYFCTLEIVPLLSFTGGLLALIDNLNLFFRI